jgi:capsular polysaccharide biosynthesis protein
MEYTINSDSEQFAKKVIDFGYVVPPSDVLPWLSGRLGGVAPPLAGLDGGEGLFLGNTVVYETKNMYLAPHFGALINPKTGEIVEETIAQARFETPDLSMIPKPSAFRGMTLEKAGVFFPWGANRNYGHFMIDALSGATALSRASIEWPLVCPPLKNWQRDALGRLGLKPIEIAEDLVHIKNVAWSNCMNTYMHWPNATLSELSTKMTQTITKSVSPSLLYISRSNVSIGRKLTNESQLEDNLRSRWFGILHPQDLSIAEQAQLFYNADVVVSTTGAQLANILFMRRGSTIIEITPTNYSGIWLRNIAYILAINWVAFYVKSPSDPKQTDPLNFSFEIDLEAFDKFLYELKVDGRHLVPRQKLNWSRKTWYWLKAARQKMAAL